MKGIHDMGGMHGTGPINPEIDEPVFHADWERRMFALWTAAFAAGMYNDNEFRFAGEAVVVRNINPADYTHLACYLRGKNGAIKKDHGAFGFPDTMAHDQGETPQHIF
jgi:hypothetical protein